MRPVFQLVFLAAPLAAGCHTISEELPSRPSPVESAVAGGIPIINIPVPKTTPTPAPVVVAPTPAPKPAPPTATPAPEPTPPPNAGEKNRKPVARVACSVYFVECNGEIVPNSHRAGSTNVGCKVHLDATTKDANGEHTYREPRWVFSNPGMVEIQNSNPWNPAITGRGRHHQDMYAEADGARCATFGIDFN
jgi:hypothetical protein